MHLRINLFILILYIFIQGCFSDLNVAMRSDGTFVTVYDCINPSQPNVVDELCVASFSLDSNARIISSQIRNLRFPSVKKKTKNKKTNF